MALSYSVTVKVVDNDTVEQIKNFADVKKGTVAPLSERRSGRGSQAAVGTDDSVPLPPLEEVEEEEAENQVFFKPTELLEDEKLVKATSVFGFQTPKKKWAMLDKASSMRSPKTPQTARAIPSSQPGTPTTPATPRTSRTPKSVTRTPKTPRTPTSLLRGESGTPRSKRKLSDSVPATPSTPYNFRRKVKNRLTKIVFDGDGLTSSSDEANFSSESSSDSDESKENEEDEGRCSRTPRMTPKRTPRRFSRAQQETPGRTPSTTPARRGRARKTVDVDTVAQADEYFLSNAERKVKTSDHTLSRLNTPKLSQEALQTIMSDIDETHIKERLALRTENMEMFPRWMTYLCEGFAVILYGLGSKKLLLSKFQNKYLKNFDCVVVNGFFPSLTLKNILNNITGDILEYCGGFVGVHEQMDYIQEVYSEADAEPLFLIINNLDGPMLRPERTQAAIARLASFPNVHLIASIDHVNAPLIIDSSKMSQYNALWFDATTMSRYTEETSYENSLLVRQSGSLALSSLIHVFKSLTPNAKGIFILLAKHQLDQKDNSNYFGLSFSDMYQRCREAFLVNSDLTLRAQLTEFRDHKLIRSKKGLDGMETLVIPLDTNTLQNFISEEEREDF